MMASSKEENTQWTTTIIISKALQHHDISRTLMAQQHRIRFSDSVEDGAFIFPLSGTAFLFLHPRELPKNCDESHVTSQIERFLQVHRNSFLFLYDAFDGGKEYLNFLQHRFLSANLRILPVRSNADIVKGMLTIVKVTSKPHVDIVRERMARVRRHILESSSVHQMLKDLM
ncbi:protein SPO16 homolog [Neosynchiropus ocellatus]